MPIEIPTPPDFPLTWSPDNHRETEERKRQGGGRPSNQLRSSCCWRKSTGIQEIRLHNKSKLNSAAGNSRQKKKKNHKRYLALVIYTRLMILHLQKQHQYIILWTTPWLFWLLHFNRAAASTTLFCLQGSTHLAHMSSLGALFGLNKTYLMQISHRILMTSLKEPC